MAREKMFDPAFQKSFTEAILKENKIRVQWHLNHGAHLKQRLESFAWDDEPDDDDEDFIDETDETQDEENIVIEEPEEKKGFGAVEKMLKEAEGEKKIYFPSLMKPVPVKTKRLLYKGLSRYGEGRSNYLKARYKNSPENKFYFPICSSWECGWTYGQENELKCPDYGRRQIMKSSFFRPNDPQLKPRD